MRVESGSEVVSLQDFIILSVSRSYGFFGARLSNESFYPFIGNRIEVEGRYVALRGYMCEFQFHPGTGHSLYL